MGLLIALLTLILVVIALFLGLLILIQLPKKEAGMGAAFGADQAAAIFGAGSGTALTIMTRWCATGFLLLCLVISVLTARNVRAQSEVIEQQVKGAPAAAATTLPATGTGLGLPAPAATEPAAAAETPAPAPATETPVAPSGN